MTKRFVLLLCISLPATWVYAQWTSQDSLKLKLLLKGSEELKLNPKAVKQIEFGDVLGKPGISEEKSWLLPDETLPEVLPKPKVVLTLMPYTAHTRYNWDPVYQRKIRVNKDTWRSTPFLKFYVDLLPSNWAHTSVAGGIRKSWEEIRASGVDFRMLSERANGAMISTMTTGAIGGIPIGHGASINGGTISGLDLMAVFTKEFWDKKGRDRRERTLEVLRTYGDSTTVNINHPVEPISR